MLNPKVAAIREDLKKEYPGKMEFSKTSLTEVLRRSYPTICRDKRLRKILKPHDGGKWLFVTLDDLAEYMAGK